MDNPLPHFVTRCEENRWSGGKIYEYVVESIARSNKSCNLLSCRVDVPLFSVKHTEGHFPSILWILRVNQSATGTTHRPTLKYTTAIWIWD